MCSYSTGGKKGLAIWRTIAVTAKSCTRCPTKQKEDLLQLNRLVNSVGHKITKAKIFSFIRKSRKSDVSKTVVSIKWIMRLCRKGATGRPYQYCSQDKASICHSVPSIFFEHISSEIMPIVTLTMSYVILLLLNWALACDALCVTHSFAVTEWICICRNGNEDSDLPAFQFYPQSKKDLFPDRSVKFRENGV